MAEISTGITIAFDTGFFAEVLSISPSGMTREPIDVTHMGTTGAREFMPSTLVTNGTVDIEFAYIPGTTPPIQDAVANPVVNDTCVITFPGPHTITGDAFMTDFSISAQLEEKITASATLHWADIVTFGI